MRSVAAIQVSALPLPLEENLERSRSHSRGPSRLRGLRDRSKHDLMRVALIPNDRATN